MNACPWTVKIWTVVMAVLSDFVAVPSSHAERYRYVFGLVCIVTLSSVMPSLMFSTVNRNLTTSYVMQSGLYLAGAYAILDFLHSFSQQHCVLVTYLLLCHFLCGQLASLKQHRRTVLYSGSIVKLNFVLMCILSVVCLLICPHIHIEGLWMTTILFIPELLGVAVSGVHCVVKGLGDLYEEHMSEDSRYKYD